MEDYDAIADAVMETERGRWFLREFARRNRVADTDEILGAITRLERRLDPVATSASQVALPAAPDPGRLATLAMLAAEIRGALTAPKPAEQRVALALGGVAELEKAIGTVEGGARAAALMLAGPIAFSRPSEDATPGIEYLAVTPPPDRAMDLVDIAFYEIGPADPPTEAIFDDVPSAQAWAADERAEAKEAEPAPQVAPPQAPHLLESLSDAEKALLFA